MLKLITSKKWETMKGQSSEYRLDEKHRFVVEDYNWAPPFSNFFPGIGGKWGIPLWAFYVNRAQGVSSFGVRDKDHAILEFYSFNKALQLIGQQGFRTFLKVNGKFYEPLRKVESSKIRQKMLVSSEELELNDFNSGLGIETNVVYYPLVNEPIAALVRELRVRNVGRRTVSLELVDGLPRVLPHGLNQSHVKFIARHIEGMMGVYSLDGIPLFRLKQTPADVPQIGEISGGNFYLSRPGGRKIRRGNFIVDPSVLFGESESYEHPWNFERSSVRQILSEKQTRENKTPCAFTALFLKVPAGGEVILYTLVGNTPDDKKLLSLSKSSTKDGFFRRKREENRSIVDQIKNLALTVSGSEEFDQYCRQNFLDNVIRGGMPLVFDTAEGKSAFYLYSRQNGDLERDYHYFVLEPTYLSQGNGHYRSVLQNRRTDTWFFPEVEDANIVTFLSLLQADAYDPLVVTGLTYSVKDSRDLEKWLRRAVKNKELTRELLELVKRPFTPGELAMKIEEFRGRNERGYEGIVRSVLRFCRQNDVGDLHEGFWVDHWTYNLDLIDNFLAVYPERLKELLIGRKVYSFYDNPDVILPRSMKYVLVDGKVRQYGAVCRDAEKQGMIEEREEFPTHMRTRRGRGEVYRTNLLVKLLSIAANRIATLDPRGIGMEMEADKPGWNDSMNGLPGLLGSSLPETLELERLCRFLRDSLDKVEMRPEARVAVFEELHQFVTGLVKALETRSKSRSGSRSFVFWDDSNRLKEAYREKTKMGIGGRERKITCKELRHFLDKCLELLEDIFKKNERKIFHPDGVPYTYFINEVSEHEPILADGKRKMPLVDPTGRPLVKAKKFRPRPVALFLEGPVHMLKVHPELRKEIYRAVRRSGVYDRKLEMYKSCEPLKKEPMEIGRIRAYAPGWIENESVYLHMEYKWLLELLRSGLHREFYRDIRTALIPFLDPAVYGRSILEGGSFIVSSSFPDEKLHGRGFQPRLSGITCEMLHIWTLMVAGERPFFLNDDGELALGFRPILPGWLFTKKKSKLQLQAEDRSTETLEIPENSFAFKFLGRTLVVYHNPRRKDTFGGNRARVKSHLLKYRGGRKKIIHGDVLVGKLASDVRRGKVGRIDVFLS